MKISKLLLPIGAASFLGFSWTLHGAENAPTSAQTFAAPDGTIAQSSRPTPPATRPLDPAGARGQARDPAPMRHPREIPTVDTDPEHFIQHARELMDQQVVTPEGQHLGSVEDLVIDVNTGQIAFLAVGPEPRLRPVPPQALRPRPDENELVLNVEPDQWENAPTIERQEIARLARERDVRRIYRHYGQDYRPAATAATDPRAEDPQVFGSPSRWQHRHPTEAHRLPGDPAIPRSQPRALPGDRTEAHADLRWERQYGAPRERELMRDQLEEQRAAEAARQERTREPVREFGARPETEAERPTLRNPRFHSSHRGTQRVPFAWDPSPQEWGAPRGERDLWAARTMVPSRERMQWAGDLMDERTIDRRSGQEMGRIDDIIIDLHRGQVQHVVVTHDELGQQFAIPFTDVEIDEQRRISVRAEREMLEQAPRYEPREARLQPQRAFRYEEQATREFGVPEQDRQPGDPRL